MGVGIWFYEVGPFHIADIEFWVMVKTDPLERGALSISICNSLQLP
jgi:hypothetical protein